MKYSSYIELSANYESVVDLDADRRNPALWKEYIVHGDMQKTIDAVCQSLNWEDQDKRRSFWIHGTYGTGKTYAAIVLKHLLEDKIDEVEDFLRRPSLSPYQKRFKKLREKGEFLVVWKSGVTDIKSGSHLMMEMEVTIKEKLAERFGDQAYYGRESLISAAKDAVYNDIINWDYVFNSLQYGLADEYDSLDEFREAVRDGVLSAVNIVKRVCDDQKLALFADTVGKFEEWLKDVIAGNGLQDTGMVFIWDEFTGFLRDCGDDNVLQRLSELCKQADAPFFLCLIVHRDPTWVDQLGNKTYERILHRYHELEYHITESAAYDLIGDSIVPRTGMATQWEGVKRDLLKSIAKYKHEFDHLDQSVNINERMLKLCPIHPLTLSMLATVAQNFGASQRTLFRFMKDRQESSQGVGFIHYIETNGPDNWSWLTPDYLWDYFFMRESDVRRFDSEVRGLIQHFKSKYHNIADPQALHVFKAALLLMAVMKGSSISNLHSRQGIGANWIGPTKKNLYRCFRGQLDEKTIDLYLDSFEAIGLLRLDRQATGDARLELPYGGGGELFAGRVEELRNRYSRHVLLSKNGVFSTSLEADLWSSTRSTANRVSIAVCSSETRSINGRLTEVTNELERCPWKIGLLAICPSKASEYSQLQNTVRKIAKEDQTGRLAVALFKEPLTKDTLDRWYETKANQELSAEDAKQISASSYEAEAAALVAEWAAVTLESQIYLCCGDIEFSALYGRSDLIRAVEKDVLFSIFPAAPEKIISINTAFRACVDKAAYGGLTKIVDNNKQHKNIVNVLKGIKAWDVDDLQGLKSLTHDDSGTITSLARLIERELSGSSRLSLDQLWLKLQQPPFGYYDTLVSGFFLGLALRSYVNGPFNWIDSVNNTFPPTAENLASMIKRMVSGKAVNEHFSSGSAVWQKFKPYAQRIFRLADRECVSEVETRKYIRARIQEIAVPFWAAKYLPDDRFGGVESAKIARKAIDLLDDFAFEISPEQDKVMADVLTLFNGRGPLRETIAKVLADKSTMLDAFRLFLFRDAPGLEDLVGDLRYTDKDLFDALRRYLQESISTWRETDIREKLEHLTEEMIVIKTLNSAFTTDEKSYEGHQKELNNVFSHMKIPGTIIETLPYEWIPTLQSLRLVSKRPWRSIENRSNVLDLLRRQAKECWEHLTVPTLILEKLLKTRNITVSQMELDEIFRSLPPLEYETTATVFYTKFEALLECISYNRNVKRINQLWIQKTGTMTVVEWCNDANVPIAWVIDGPFLRAVQTLKAVQDSTKVDRQHLEDAIDVLEAEDYSLLKDSKHLMNCFFGYIGDSYREFFIENRDALVARLKTSASVSSDVYSWTTKIPEIKRVLNEFLEQVYRETAKGRVRAMPEPELREMVLGLLEKSPELYSYFLR